MKQYEIWIGNYHLGQGFHHDGNPEFLGTETASSFQVACLKYELRSKLKWLEKVDGTMPINSQDVQWWYKPETNSNSWTGKYYETKEEALKSFK